MMKQRHLHIIAVLMVLLLPAFTSAQNTIKRRGAIDSEKSGIGGENISYTTCPDDNHPHLIDLCLPSGTKWACCNVKSDKPESYGGYYRWGETEERSYYNITGGNLPSDTDISGTEYDVAHVKWGGSWCMPTVDQCMELMFYTSNTWTTLNGVNGRLFTGPNGGSIFLPAGGSKSERYLDNCGKSGSYNSSSITLQYSNVRGLSFNSNDIAIWNSGWPPTGKNVRPVVSYNGVVTPGPGFGLPPVDVEAVDLGLPSRTKWASMNVGAFKPEDYGHHFAWGETNFKPYDCTLEKYSLCTNGDESTCKQLGVIAGTEYDVARFRWGKDWQMPTEGQVNELCKYCTTELIQCNGVNGIRFTGVNGNSIFLPSAGYRHGYVSGNKGRGLDYWSATQKGVSTAAILSTNLDANNPNIGLHSCYVGCFVRPVLPDTTIIDFYDWNTLKAICVKNWDSNGDGELSKDEAAAVTDLGRVFYKSYIKSFNELKYFTGLTTIGWDAFNGCRNLTDISIPNTVTSIEAYAFWECRNLKAIAIPKSVTSIDSRAFRYCI